MAYLYEDLNTHKASPHYLCVVCFCLLSKGFIHLLFPNAKIIHCVRDFHDLLLSNFKYKFDDIGLEFSLRVGDLVAFFHSYREMMRHWEKVRACTAHVFFCTEIQTSFLVVDLCVSLLS